MIPPCRVRSHIFVHLCLEQPCDAATDTRSLSVSNVGIFIHRSTHRNQLGGDWYLNRTRTATKEESTEWNVDIYGKGSLFFDQEINIDLGQGFEPFDQMLALLDLTKKMRLHWTQKVYKDVGPIQDFRFVGKVFN